MRVTLLGSSDRASPLILISSFISFNVAIICLSNPTEQSSTLVLALPSLGLTLSLITGISVEGNNSGTP